MQRIGLHARASIPWRNEAEIGVMLHRLGGIDAPAYMYAQNLLKTHLKSKPAIVVLTSPWSDHKFFIISFANVVYCHFELSYIYRAVTFKLRSADQERFWKYPFLRKRSESIH